mmetsp:Transcript_33857/g.58980  ORF Transcript_33857/g.58980 Transcript_33857/m.58980 type:complete len:84 (+) Transcript_33857:6506-6757(+)
MDFQNSASQAGVGGRETGMIGADRRERQGRLAMETGDITKDPYYMKNEHGTIECRLCKTLYSSEGSYIAHTLGRKHQTSLESV